MGCRLEACRQRGLGQPSRRCPGGWHAAPAASAAATVAGTAQRWRGGAGATAVASLQDACLQFAMRVFLACPFKGKVYYQHDDPTSSGLLFLRHDMSPAHGSPYGSVPKLLGKQISLCGLLCSQCAADLSPGEGPAAESC